MTKLTIDIPDGLARKAREYGLPLDSGTFELLLREAVRYAAGKKLLADEEGIQAADTKPAHGKARKQRRLNSKMKLAIPQRSSIIFGFDSAWVDKTPGAICAIAFDKRGKPTFHEPIPVSFAKALKYIKDKRKGHDYSLVAIDQPTLVPNESGSRPVDKVAASLISFIGGGVQPANRGKQGMFGNNAPIWGFLKNLESKQQPMQQPLKARAAKSGHFLIEVFPALALPALHSDFAKRLAAPKYNPENKHKFRIEDWQEVAQVVAATARQLGIADLASWVDGMGTLNKPGKVEQDFLDASIGALVGLLWRGGPTGQVAMLGDTKNGYMITPISTETQERLETFAQDRKVPFHLPPVEK